MAISLQFTLLNPAAGKEEAFVQWYSKLHAARGVLTPGILAAQCFRRIDGPWPQGVHDYLNIWEFDDPTYALEQLEIVRGTDKMPWSDTVDRDGIQPPTMWIRAQVRNGARVPSDSSNRGTCVLMLANALEGRGQAFEDAILKQGGLTNLADLPGVLSVDFLTLAEKQIRGNCRKYPLALLFELHDEQAGMGTLRDVLPALPELDAARWLAPVFRPFTAKLNKHEGADQLRAAERQHGA